MRAKQITAFIAATLIGLGLVAAYAFAGQMVRSHIQPETLVYNAIRPTGDWFTANERIKGLKYYGMSYVFTSQTLLLDTGTGFVSQALSDFAWAKGIGKLTIQKDGSNYVVAWAGGQSAAGETLTSNAFATFDFTSTWLTVSATIISNNSFTTTQSGSGVSYPGIFTAGVLRKVKMVGSTTAGILSVNALSSDHNSRTLIAAAGAYGYYTGVVYPQYYVRGDTLGATVTILTLECYTVLTPTNGSTSGQFGVILTSTKGGAQGITSVTGSPYNNASYTVTVSAQ